MICPLFQDLEKFGGCRSDPTSPRRTIGQGSTQLGGLRKQTPSPATLFRPSMQRAAAREASTAARVATQRKAGWNPRNPENPLGCIAPRDREKCLPVGMAPTRYQ